FDDVVVPQLGGGDDLLQKAFDGLDVAQLFFVNDLEGDALIGADMAGLVNPSHRSFAEHFEYPIGSDSQFPTFALIDARHLVGGEPAAFDEILEKGID